jgi:hypothetical protein|tara:strand:- start:833 stop:1069 length:237 start_codon:yes stop_codon:yes gene_type:complete
MSYTKNIIVEGFAVGISVLLLGLVVRYIIAKFENVSTNFIFKNRGMWLSLFLTGFILHVGLDLIGLNSWYCKNCAGCK